MISDTTAPAQSPPSYLTEDVAALDLLDRLAEAEPPRVMDWFPETQLVEIVATAERLRCAEEADRLTAPELAQALERHPETRARMLINHQARFRTWSLAEELIERSRRAIFGNDPFRAVRLSRLAVAVADHLDFGLYPKGLTFDFRARAWSNLGNSYRCASQLKSATAALDRAKDLLLEGTGDPLEEGILLSLDGSLQTDYGRYAAAVGFLEGACSIYRELDEDVCLARTLIKLVTPLHFGSLGNGLAVAREAERLLDPEHQPELFVLARHNHIVTLADSGRPEQAAMLLEASRKYYRQADNAWAIVNLGWVEAQLSAALGNLEEAEAAFAVLFDEVVATGRRLESALVALDLSACRLALGKTREAADLASSMAEMLRSWGAHSKAHEAWALLHHALKIERASVELIREISLFVRQSWSNPELPLSKKMSALSQAFQPSR